MLTICFKGHGNEADFLGFLQKLVPHESLTLPFGPFRFWLRICGDIRIQKTTPRYHQYGELLTLRISDTGSRRLPVLLSWGVDNSPHHLYAESATPRIPDTESRLLKKTLCIDDTESRRLPAPVLWWVAGSPYFWVGESQTPHITDTESQRLRVSLSQGVDDSAYWWYGESLFEKKLVKLRFSVL